MSDNNYIKKHIFKSITDRWYDPKSATFEKFFEKKDFWVEVYKWLKREGRAIRVYKDHADFLLVIDNKNTGKKGLAFFRRIDFFKTGKWKVGARKALNDPCICALTIRMGFIKIPRQWFSILKLSERVHLEVKNPPESMRLKGRPNQIQSIMRAIALKSFRKVNYLYRLVFFDEIMGKQVIPLDFLTPEVLRTLLKIQEVNS